MDATQPIEAVVDAPETETPATEDTTVEQTTVEDMYADDAPAEPEEAEQDEGEEAPEGDEDDSQEDEAEKAANSPGDIPAPLSWKAEEKEHFAKLPREAQEVIARREQERDRFVQTKAQEAAQARQQAHNEAMQAVQQLRQQQAEELENVAAQIVPQRPPHRLMAEDPDAYADQMEAFEYWTAQRQHAQQLAHQRRQQAEYIQQQQEQEEAARAAQLFHATLSEKFPEVLDPNEGPKLMAELGQVAIELGYPPELLKQADATDILAMKNIRELKADAEKWRNLQKDKMAGVRAAKQLPKLAKPGAPSAARKAPTDPVKLLYPND